MKLLDNPQTQKEIPAAYRTYSADYVAGLLAGQRLKQEQIVQMLTKYRDDWVRPSGINFRFELTKVIERIESV